ncbi:unnamed protein product [Haemonchus placei]|uniref:Tropomyosin n=1 Tax=Haemonchus placei TaxID=6290 RepID=A0A0N4WJ11_HAEPC|nr:unnamed protein product [Haemonchus placei]
MAASKKELQQRRKDNADLCARINALLHSSDSGSEEEVTSHKEEIAEINALRDEINEKQVEVAKAQREKKLAEDAQEKFQEDNNTRIIMLQEQVNSSQQKIIALDTELGIMAQKDVERYKNAFSNMAKAKEAAQIREHEEGDLRNRLNVALEDLEFMERAKEEAEENINNKEKMLRKAMDTITKLEMASQ